MSRAKAFCVAVAFAIGTGVAWAQSVHTDFDPSVNFSSFMTYYWAKTDPVPGNDIVNQRIMGDVDRWLTAKGWTKVAKGQAADLAVIANVSTTERQSLDTFYTGFGGWGYGGWGPTETVVKTYLEGTLVIDIYNARNKKLVWRGVATDSVSKDPQKNAEHIAKATEKMFKKNFPPGLAD